MDGWMDELAASGVKENNTIMDGWMDGWMDG